MSVILFNAKQAVLLLLRQGGQQTVKKSTIQPLMAKNLTSVSGIHTIFEEVASTFRLHKDEPVVGIVCFSCLLWPSRLGYGVLW
jgi:hypothetical protein